MMTEKIMRRTSPEKEYYVDTHGRICPVHQIGVPRERWQDVPTFDEAMEEIAAFALREVFPNENLGIGTDESPRVF